MDRRMPLDRPQAPCNWECRMNARNLLVGILTSATLSLAAGPAGADGGSDSVDLRSVVNMDWRDEARATARAAGPTRATTTCGKSGSASGRSSAFRSS